MASVDRLKSLRLFPCLGFAVTIFVHLYLLWVCVIKVLCWKVFYVQIAICAGMPQHPIKKGPEGGRFQPEPHTHAKKRYLLEDKKIRTGPEGGKFQAYDGNKKRYLLK